MIWLWPRNLERKSQEAGPRQTQSTWTKQKLSNKGLRSKDRQLGLEWPTHTVLTVVCTRTQGSQDYRWERQKKSHWIPVKKSGFASLFCSFPMLQLWESYFPSLDLYFFLCKSERVEPTHLFIEISSLIIQDSSVITNLCTVKANNLLWSEKVFNKYLLCISNP